MRKPLNECRLYTFVDSAYLHGRAPAEVARQLCDGGSDIIQLRAKGASVDDCQRMAEAILSVTERAGVHLVINDHPAVAQILPNPFVHLGQEDFFDAGHIDVAQLSAQPPSTSQFRVGLSSHAPDQAERAIAAGADYIAIGPVFATGTKPGRPPVTLEYVRWAARHVSIPWFAIGGIDLKNLDDVLAAGARRVCVVSAILNADDIAGTCQRFRERLLSAPLQTAVPLKHHPLP